MIRRIVAVVFLCLLGCSAQQAVSPDLNQRIERQVRASLSIPPYVQVEIGQRKPSEFPGFDALTVKFTFGEKSSTREFLLSGDGKTLYSMTRMDLTADPFAKTMAKIDLTGRPMRGNKDAKVTVVIYDDFQCPYCSRFYDTLFNDVMKTYGDRVKVYLKDFPLFEIHPWAGRAANDANCLAAQSSGAFWDFSDYVHANGRTITGQGRPVDVQLAELDRLASAAGQRHSVDSTKLAECLKAQPSEQMTASVKEGEALGVAGTPYIIINGEKLDGALPASELETALDHALRDAGEGPPAPPAMVPVVPPKGSD